MVHEKHSWKWHQCLQVPSGIKQRFSFSLSLQARHQLISYDSEYENDDYPAPSLIMEDKQGK